MAARLYGPISKRAFDAIRAELAESGIHVPDAAMGSAKAPAGVTVSWQYIQPSPPESHGQLYITLDGSWLVEGSAWAAVDKLVKKYEGT